MLYLRLKFLQFMRLLFKKYTKKWIVIGSAPLPLKNRPKTALESNLIWYLLKIVLPELFVWKNKRSNYPIILLFHLIILSYYLIILLSYLTFLLSYYSLITLLSYLIIIIILILLLLSSYFSMRWHKSELDGHWQI